MEGLAAMVSNKYSPADNTNTHYYKGKAKSKPAKIKQKKKD